MKIPKPVTLSFVTSYGCRSVLEKKIFSLNESMTSQKDVAFKSTYTFLKEKTCLDVFK